MLVGRSSAAKKPQPIRPRHVIWLSWKLVVSLSIALCLFAFFRLHSPDADAAPSLSRRSMSRAKSRDILPFGPPKIAFLFLARRNLPLDFLWENFFEVGFPFLNFPRKTSSRCASMDSHSLSLSLKGC